MFCGRFKDINRFTNMYSIDNTVSMVPIAPAIVFLEGMKNLVFTTLYYSRYDLSDL